MEWIDVYEDKRRFELKEGNQVLAILQFVDGVYVGKDNITKLDFTVRDIAYKNAPNKLNKRELFYRAEKRLSENWITKAESLSKAIAGIEWKKEVIVTDYALRQIVDVVELDKEKNRYEIFKARFKGVFLEGYKLLNMFESISDGDIFMEPKDSDKIFVRHDAAVRECVSLNESLRKGK